MAHLLLYLALSNEEVSGPASPRQLLEARTRIEVCGPLVSENDFEFDGHAAGRLGMDQGRIEKLRTHPRTSMRGHDVKLVQPTDEPPSLEGEGVGQNCEPYGVVSRGTHVSREKGEPKGCIGEEGCDGRSAAFFREDDFVFSPLLVKQRMHERQVLRRRPGDFQLRVPQHASDHTVKLRQKGMPRAEAIALVQTRGKGSRRASSGLDSSTPSANSCVADEVTNGPPRSSAT